MNDEWKKECLESENNCARQLLQAQTRLEANKISRIIRISACSNARRACSVSFTERGGMVKSQFMLNNCNLFCHQIQLLSANPVPHVHIKHIKLTSELLF